MSTACLVHPGRPAVTSCVVCDRPLCSSCGHPGPHGWTCEPCLEQPRRRAQPTPPAPSPPPAPPSGGRRRGGGGVVARGGRLGATRVTPTVIALVVVNTVIFAITRGDPTSAYARFAMIPYNVHHGQWYRLLTAAFLHVSIEHLLFNMITLLVIGSPVEALVGRTRFLAIYLVAGLGGSVCSYLVSKPFIEGIGASGAIFGLFGAYAVLARRHRFDVRTVAVLIGIELVLSFTQAGIDWRAHLGGLVVGGAYTSGLVALDDRRTAITTVREVGVTVATLAALALLVLLPPGHVNL